MSIVSDITSGIFGGADAASDAANVQSAGYDAAIAEQRRQFDINQETLSPFIDAGTDALTQELAYLGLAGADAQQQAYDDFLLSPNQQFLQQQGEQAITRNAAATGGLQGGNVLKELQTYGQGTASQALSEQLNRLASLRGGSQTAATNLSSFGTSMSNNVANSLIGQSEANASGILGAQQANAGLAETAIGLGSMFFSDRRLKTAIVKIGELSSGLGWYSWEWSEKGKELTGLENGEGVMADEVLKVYPDLVDQSGEYMRVNYEGIV